MTVTIDMSEYQTLKEKADRAEYLEKQVSYWQGEYEDCNRSRLHEQDRACALQLFLVDELGYTFNEAWDISEDIAVKHRARREEAVEKSKAENKEKKEAKKK